MKRLVSLKGLSKEEWLRYRKGGLTGTDAAAVVNLNPYKSAFAVYQDKVTDEIEDADNESMRQGRDLEEYVARRFTEETGLQVRRANAIYYNEEHPYLLADFDRLVVGQKAGLECKTVSPYSAEKWADGKIPVHYHLQVQHYLGVSGYDCWYIAALIFGTEFVIRKIERDEALIKDLIRLEERFWKERVLAKCPPDPDGSENYTEMLRKQYYGNAQEEAITLFGVEESLRRRDEITELIGKLESEKSMIEQTIQKKMGEGNASKAYCKDYRIFWTDTLSKRVDTKRLKEEQPVIYNQFLKETPSKRFLVKKEKAA